MTYTQEVFDRQQELINIYKQMTDALIKLLEEEPVADHAESNNNQTDLAAPALAVPRILPTSMRSVESTKGALSAQTE